MNSKKKPKSKTIKISGLYEEMGTKSVDAKHRITVSEPLSPGYRIKMFKDVTNGSVLLVPLIEIPVHEQWLYKNKKALKMVLDGIQSAKEGKGRKLDLNELAKE